MPQFLMNYRNKAINLSSIQDFLITSGQKKTTEKSIPAASVLSDFLTSSAMPYQSQIDNEHPRRSCAHRLR